MTEALPDAKGDRLLRSASALLISNGAGAVLGVGFYVVAARLYSVPEFGRGATEISAALLLASLSQLNLPVVFPRFLFAAGARATTLARLGYAAATTVGLVMATVFLVGWHHSFIQPGFWPALFFVVSVPLWVVFSIQDAALIGLRKTFWIPVENTSFSIIKIALLPVLVAIAPNQGVFLSYVAPVVLCIAGISAYLFGKVLPGHLEWAAGRVSLPPRRSVSSILMGEYCASLAYISLGSAPTLLVAGEIGTKSVAFFQTPWMVGTSIDIAMYYVATSIISEAAARAGDAPNVVRRGVRFGLLLLVPAAIVLALCGHYFLEILGATYAAHGTRLLQCLALALPLLGINVLYITYARLARRVRRIVALPLALTTAILATSAALVPHLGVTGVGVGFLAGQGACALAVLPSVVAQYRRPTMAPGFALHLPLVVKGLGEDWGVGEAGPVILGDEVIGGDGDAAGDPAAAGEAATKVAVRGRHVRSEPVAAAPPAGTDERKGP